jgi:hypothetical protein
MVRFFPRLRACAVLLLAYTLVLQGLLGALSAGAQAREARLAAQLGVICTVHGIADPRHASDSADPTPGKLACVEHCLLGAGAGPAPPPSGGVALDVVSWSRSAAAPSVGAHQPGSSPECAPPPPRGPPSSMN